MQLVLIYINTVLVTRILDTMYNPLFLAKIPQGSILGPLLFLCYVNDMPISIRCKLLLYADDSALIVSGSDPQSIADMLPEELE